MTGNQTALVAAIGVALGSRTPSKGPVRVVDFGGHDGKHADLIEPLFPEVSFEWVVVDLPPVVEAMTHRMRPGLAFVSDLSEALASGVDVVLASASLNYAAGPMEILRTMCAHSSFVVLTRLPLWPIAQHAAAVQHAQRRPMEISYPTWFFSESRFMNEIPAGSKILLDFTCPDDRAAFEGHYLSYRGLVICTNHMKSLNRP